MAAPVEPDPVALASLQADQLPQPLASAAANQVPVEQGQHAAGQGHEVFWSVYLTFSFFFRLSHPATRLAYSTIFFLRHPFSAARCFSFFSCVGFILSRRFYFSLPVPLVFGLGR